MCSVIIPVYNVREYLDACVNSILNQTNKKIEIIFVDDNSLDRCPQICDEYAKKDNGIKINN
jgi:glycosyltransferase involved in cell wall biosynthesis